MLNLPLETLKKRSEFLAAAKTELKWIRPAFVLQVNTPSSSENSRYGITASRKLGGAVKRNFAKRRLRALAQNILSKYAQNHTDYVFIARGAIATQSFADIAHDLEKILKKIKGTE